jgi:hypothetical protein
MVAFWTVVFDYFFDALVFDKFVLWRALLNDYFFDAVAIFFVVIIAFFANFFYLFFNALIFNKFGTFWTRKLNTMVTF